MSTKKIMTNYFFEFKGDYPRNKFKCQFFKVGSIGEELSDKSLYLEKAYCSIRDEILTDYKVCCTKHEGDKPDNYLHCQSYLEKIGNMNDKDRLELRNLKLMKESVLKADKSARAARNATWVSLFMLIIAGLGLYLAYLEPQRSKQAQIQEQIKYIYRNINANEDIFISNSNELNKFRENTNIDNLPFNFIELNLTRDIHDELQKKIGLVNYRFLLYYTEQTNDLNNIVNKIKDNFYSNEVILKDKEIYLTLMDKLNKEGWQETKFNYLLDTGCLLKIFQKSYPYIEDERNKQIECRSNSLNRILFHFGYLEVETPEWMKPKLREASKERGIDAWWID